MWLPTAEQILPVLSVTAMISTISLFFCGFPICWEVWKRRGTRDISGMPFIMGLIGGSFWLRYGFLRHDMTMVTVNVVAVTLFLSYSIFYLFMSKPRTSFGVQLLFSLSLISLMVFLVMQYGMRLIDVLGFACMTFNIGCFAAPLAGLRVVLRTRCCDTLPLPMCMANLAVSSQWLLYGALIKDIYVISPNACGVFLSIVQLSLFLIFPMKPDGRAPLSCCFPCIQPPEKPLDDDLEKAVISEKDVFTAIPQQHTAIIDMEKNLDGECVVPLLSAAAATSPATATASTTHPDQQEHGPVQAGVLDEEKVHRDARHSPISNTNTDESNGDHGERGPSPSPSASSSSISQHGSTTRLTKGDGDDSLPHAARVPAGNRAAKI